MTITLTMSLPAKELSPNGRYYFMKKSAATKAARLESKLLAISKMNELGIDPPRWKTATMKARFYFPTKRRRDRSNCAASLKAHEDGLTDAGVWQDDSGVVHEPPEILFDKSNPRLEITIISGTP